MKPHRSYFEVTRNVFIVSGGSATIIGKSFVSLESLGFKQVNNQEDSANTVEYHPSDSYNPFFVWNWWPHVIACHKERISEGGYRVEVRTYLRLSSIAIKLGVLLFLGLLTFFMTDIAFTLSSDIATVDSFNNAFLWLILLTILILIQVFWGMKLVSMGIKHDDLLDKISSLYTDNINENFVTHLGGRKCPLLSLIVLLLFAIWGTSISIHIGLFSSAISFSLFGTILCVLLGMLGVFLISVVLMATSKEIQTRLSFVLVGLLVTLSYSFFYNFPLLFKSIFSEYRYQILGIRELEAQYHELGKPPNMTNGNLFLSNARLRFNQGAFIIFVVLLVLSLSLALSLKIRYISSIIERLRHPRKDSIYHEAVLRFKFFPLFSVLVLLLWLSISIGVLSATFLNIVLTFLLFLPKSVVLTLPIFGNFLLLLDEQQALLASYFSYSRFLGYRDLLFLYLLPFWFFSITLCVLKIRELKCKKKFYRICTETGFENKQVKVIVSELSEFLKVSKPKIYFYPSLSIQANTSASLYAHKKRLFLSKGIILCLSNSECAALLAHEMYHIKQHSAIWGILQLLSEITLFGRGFLATMLNSYEIELAADRFALKWLKRNGGSKADLIHLFQVTEAVNALYGSTGIWQSVVSWRPEDENRCKNRTKKLTHSLKDMLHRMYLLYFSDQVSSYIHPTIHERIAAIDTME